MTKTINKGTEATLEKPISCKLDLTTFKSRFLDYNQTNLKKAYFESTQITTDNDINFMIRNNNIYLIPTVNNDAEDFKNMIDIIF